MFSLSFPPPSSDFGLRRQSIPAVHLYSVYSTDLDRNYGGRGEGVKSEEPSYSDAPFSTYVRISSALSIRVRGGRQWTLIDIYGHAGLDPNRFLTCSVVVFSSHKTHTCTKWCKPAVFYFVTKGHYFPEEVMAIMDAYCIVIRGAWRRLRLRGTGGLSFPLKVETLPHSTAETDPNGILSAQIAGVISRPFAHTTTNARAVDTMRGPERRRGRNNGAKVRRTDSFLLSLSFLCQTSACVRAWEGR